MRAALLFLRTDLRDMNCTSVTWCPLRALPSESVESSRDHLEELAQVLNGILPAATANWCAFCMFSGAYLWDMDKICR